MGTSFSPKSVFIQSRDRPCLFRTMRFLLAPLLLCFLQIGNVLSFGEPVDIDLDDPMVKDVADFALTSYNQKLDSSSKMNEVKVNKAQQQVVNGKNYILEVELIKDGQTVKSCDVVVWVRPNMDEKQLTKMDCQQANVEEEDEEEEEEDDDVTLDMPKGGGSSSVDVNDKDVRDAADFALATYNDKLDSDSKMSQVKVNNARKQVVNGMNYIMEIELLKNGKAVKTCDVTVWVREYMNHKEVTKMNCHQAKGSVGAPTDVDADKEEVVSAAEFALDMYNDKLDSDSKMNEVKVTKAQEQVVNGVNYIMELQLLKNGEAVKTCDVVVWVRDYMNHRELTKMQCHQAESEMSLGGLSEIDVNTPAVQDAAKFALSTYNQKLDSSSKMNEIRVSRAQSQVVNGMNYLMDVELVKNGKVTKECEVVVWVRPYKNQREVTRMDCHRA